MVFKSIISMAFMFVLLLGVVGLAPAPVSAAHPGTANSRCEEESGFLGFENWYRGLTCEDSGHGPVIFDNLTNLWVVLSNVMLIAIRIAGLLAVVFIVYGGIRYITSQGEPENIQAAKKVITNAIIGLVIAMLAATIVGFIAGQF